MGSISLSNAPNSGSVSLSAPPQTDWIQFSASGPPNRKTGGGSLLTDAKALPPANLTTYVTGAVSVTWTDGTPVPSGTSTGGYQTIGTGGEGHIGDGFAIGAAANTNARTLVLYWSVFSGTARVNVSLTDNSAPVSEATVTAAPGVAQDFVTTITYSADSDAQLAIGVFLSAPATPAACVRVQAAKVLNVAPPPAPTPVPPPPPSADANPYAPPFEAQFDPDRSQQFIIEKLLRALHTATVVRVLAVRPSGPLGGFVDVQPLVLDVTTGSTVIEQSPIYNVPYVRYQGGTSAVILDPVPGDNGLCIFAERDITTVKRTGQEGPPATQRAYSSADGLYVGGVLNPPPGQYVLFQPGGAGIAIVSPGDVGLQAGGAVNIQAGGNVNVSAGTTMRLAAPSGLTIDANLTLNGTMSGTATGGAAYQFAGTIRAPDAVINNVTQSTHRHPGVQPGAGTSGGPTN